MSKEDLELYIRYLKAEAYIDDLLKRKGLNKNLAKDFLIPYLCDIEPTILAQKLGIHRTTVKRYYELLAKLDSLEFELIFRYLFKNRYAKEDGGEK